MKTIELLFCLIFYIYFGLSAQNTNTSEIRNIEIKRIASITWNQENGIKISEDLATGLINFEDYCMISSNKIAILSATEPKVYFYNLDSKLWDTPIDVSPSTFLTYMPSNQHLYLLSYEGIIEYTLEGEIVEKQELNK